MEIANPFTFVFFLIGIASLDIFFYKSFLYFLHHHKPENSEEVLHFDICDYGKIFVYFQNRSSLGYE